MKSFAALSVVSGRLSYAFGLVGPCVSLDTACSSFLVAAHASRRALEGGESAKAVDESTIRKLVRGAEHLKRVRRQKHVNLQL